MTHDEGAGEAYWRERAEEQQGRANQLEFQLAELRREAEMLRAVYNSGIEHAAQSLDELANDHVNNHYDSGDRCTLRSAAKHIRGLAKRT